MLWQDGRKSKAWLVHAGRKWALQKFAKSTEVLVWLALDIDTSCGTRRSAARDVADQPAQPRALALPPPAELGLLKRVPPQTGACCLTAVSSLVAAVSWECSGTEELSRAR